MADVMEGGEGRGARGEEGWKGEMGEGRGPANRLRFRNLCFHSLP